jgi:hypothetical protein
MEGKKQDGGLPVFQTLQVGCIVETHHNCALGKITDLANRSQFNYKPPMAVDG